MTEILSLSTLCRCCHVDGCFKSLRETYQYRHAIEVYSAMLEDTFGVSILVPPKSVSDSICEECIVRLRDAVRFKQQVIDCEHKFIEYLQRESLDLKESDIKLEIEEDISDQDNLDDEEKWCEVPTVKKDDDSEYECNGGADDVGDELKTEDIKSVNTTHETKLRRRKLTVKKQTQKSKTSKSTAKNTKTSQSTAKNTKIKTERNQKACKVCNAIFDSSRQLRQHYNTQHNFSDPFKCTVCPTVGDSFDDMLTHARTHGNTKVQCRFCIKEFSDKRNLKEHEYHIHMKITGSKCAICNKMFNYRCSLQKHMLWHNGLTKKYYCDICGKATNDKANLRIHVENVHLLIRKYECDHCGKTFTQKKCLKEHILRIHMPKASGNNSSGYQRTYKNKNFYPCKGCSLTFNDIGKYRSHVKRHSKEGTLPNICHICGRGFSNTYSLNRHVMIHSGVKNYQCDICLKTYFQKAQVQRHKKNVHSDKKPRFVKCQICKMNVRDLEKHTQRHVVRPFLCEHCPKSYPEKNTLNRHVRQVHLGIYKHSCLLCGANFKTGKLLDKHTSKNHKDSNNKAVNYDAVTLEDLVQDKL